MKKPLYLLLTTALALNALPALSTSKSLGAHVHGAASLDIAIDSSLVTLNFSGPLDNLIGFENIPQTDQQKAKVSAMQDRLKKPGPLFYFTKAAQCRVQSVKLTSIVLGNPPAAGEDEGHADVDAEYVYDCAQMKSLQSIKIMLFDFYPNLQKIKVAVVSGRGQTATELSAEKRMISW